MNTKSPAFASWLGTTNDVTRTFLAASQMPDVINIAGGLPEASLYPVDELATIAAQVIRDNPAEALDYSPIEGLAVLRDALAARFSQSGLDLTRENVLIVSGGMQGLDLMGKAMLDPGDLVAAQAPAYLGALDAWKPRSPAYRCYFPDRSDFDAYSALTGAKFAYSVPNFSNPTGKLISTRVRQALVESAHDTGTWLLEDNPYGKLYYDADPLPDLLQLSAEFAPGPYAGPIVYLGTLSKEAVPGLRIGWVIANAEMIRTLTTVKQGTDMSCSSVSQLILAKAIETGLLERLQRPMIALYKQRRDALCQSMQEHLAGHFEWEIPVGGMFVWAVAKDSSLNTDHLLTEALQHGVCVSPSSAFDPLGEDKQALRINFTLNAPDKLEEGIKRLAKATESLLQMRKTG
ncbi:MAG: PLP-dependent aminotransferase family protein [Granulosicoccus sp.]